MSYKEWWYLKQAARGEYNEKEIPAGALIVIGILVIAAAVVTVVYS